MPKKLWLPICLLAFWTSAAEGQSLAPGNLSVWPLTALDPIAFSWPWLDLQGSLCGPSDTIEAADCKILSSTSTPGPVRKPNVLGESTEDPNTGARLAAVRMGTCSGDIDAFETSCGRWRGSWSFDTTPQPISTLSLFTSSGFLGRMQAIVRFVFTRDSDGLQVTLVRTAEGRMSGAWGFWPGNPPPGDSNLWVDLGPALPNPWTIGECRPEDPPHGQE